MRTKKFLWTPTRVYAVSWHDVGYQWLTYAWLDVDSKMYVSKEPAKVKYDVVSKSLKVILP